ncbi:MAG: SRPBCC family protein [Actinobacteria bacterium]|jgi:carbon monoxide dehydrogenase subunit G|nr:SRPBCC family protein [Actinomycetota bacterium]
MRMEHNFTVAAPIDAVWKALLDLERVVPCMPGASLTSFTGAEFVGTVKVRLGPIALLYKGNGKFTETDAAAHEAVIEASGKDSRGNGTASATITATLRQEGGDTAVTVLTDLNVTGKPAQFGRGLIAEVGGKIIGQFADCLSDKLGSLEEPATPVPSEESPPPSATPGLPPASAARPVRPVPAVADEINLLDTAGAPLLKRVAPPAAGLVLLLLVMRWFRRR